MLHVHEAKGTQTQDRVYQYSFMKPHYVKTLILEGDGKGSGGVWTGGDQVSGHQGGLFSGIHLKISINDPRAVSLRGVTIPQGLLQRIVDDYATIPGKLAQVDGGKINGVHTDRLDLKASDPGANGGVTDSILYLSKETHWPVRQIIYSGSQIVLDENVTDLKTNVGLTQSRFPVLAPASQRRELRRVTKRVYTLVRFAVRRGRRRAGSRRRARLSADRNRR